MSKIVIIGDAHFGAGDLIFLEKSQLKFFRHQLVPYCKENGIKKIVFEGDVFHNRKSVDIYVKNKILDLFSDTLKEFDVTIYLGNHDVYYRNTNEVHSLKYLDVLRNVTVIEKIRDVEIYGRKFLFVPWLFEEGLFGAYIDGKNCAAYDCVFGHFDIIGSKMNPFKVSERGLDKDLLFKFKLVFSGHYHSKSIEEHKNGVLIYTGTPYQLDRGDRNDERGFFVLDTKDMSYEFVGNSVSVKFLETTFPDDSIEVSGNKIDVYVKEDELDTEVFKKFLDDLNRRNPFAPPEIRVLSEGEARGDIHGLNIENKSLEEIFFDYIQTLKIEDEKKHQVFDLALSLMGKTEDE